MPRQVTAFSNATVKRLRSLRDKKGRRAEGLFLAEGLRILTEARDSGRLPEIVAFSAEGGSHPLGTEIIAATEAAGGEAIETTPDILTKMSGKDNPQMLLGAYRVPTRRSGGSTAPGRRCGSSPRRCAIPVTSVPSSGQATRSAPAG
jgi:TrmH family RNA methyltransferase